MTTLAGIIRTQGVIATQDDAERLLQALAIYQPEANRSWRRNQAALVCTLRRFTPEDTFDRQPLSQGGDKPVLVFTGRLDNRDELVQALAIPAPLARVMADSALVLAAYEAWGEDSPRHLLGDFAFAVWLPLQERLFLARDPMGMRPLYWHQGASLFGFSSAAQALHALPEVPRELDEERLAEFLALAPGAGPRSFFRGIQRLEPGHYLVLEQGRVRIVRFHRLDPEKRILLARDEDYVEAFRERVEEAVRPRLRSQGEVAAHLSSGFDSSTVCTVAAPQLATMNKRLYAFTLVPRKGFDGPAPSGRHGNEGPGAAALARRHPNIEHFLVPNGASHLEAAARASVCASSPLLNPIGGASSFAIRNAALACGARVWLVGNMGNYGLSFHGSMRLPSLLRRGRVWSWYQEARALHRQGGRNWKGLLADSLGPFLPEWFWSKLSKQRRGDLSGLFNYSALRPEVAHALDIRERVREANLRLSYRPWADGRHARCMALYRFDLGDTYLMTLAHGVVERDPTADVRLLEFCLAIPEDLFLRNGQSRWLLRQAYGDRLPPEILHARTKGYPAPDWYETAGREREAMAAELERLAASPTAARLLDLETMRRDLANWPDSGWERSEVHNRYLLKLLRGLSVGMYIRKVEGGNE